MKKKTSYCIATVLLLLFLMLGIESHAVDGIPPPGPPPPPGLPIDGGVLFLLISGIALGVTGLRKNKD